MTALSVSLVRGAVTSPFKKAGSAGRSGTALPADRRVLPAVRIAPGALASYNRICGFSEPGVLPLTYPHVLGFPLAMRVMTARAFPLPVLGLVHTWIEITRHTILRPGDEPEISAYAAELLPHRRGTEVTMVTEARVAGALAWESRSGYLSRHATDTRDADVKPPADAAAPGELPPVARWQLSGDLGRRYGAASGDRNPIHLYPLTARLFGFPRAIAHGMWTVAHCLAEADEPGRIRHLRADFRAPVLLPATVTYAADSAGSVFQVRDGSRIHLTGTVSRDG